MERENPMSCDYGVSIRPDFLDVNVQAYLFDHACHATRGMVISAPRWSAGVRLALVYSVLCSMARNGARKS